MTDVVRVQVDETLTDEEQTAIRRALLMESIRTVERLGLGIGGYAETRVEALTLKMARDMFPDLQLTREIWTALGGGRGGTAPVHLRPVVERWRATVTGEAPPITDPPEASPQSPPVTAPPPDKPEEDERQERTCECTECTDRECQGDCEQCDDYDCEQCHDGHSYHGDCDVCNGRHENSVCEQCGYCSECDAHLDTDRYGDNFPGPCDQGHCHDCEHRC